MDWAGITEWTNGGFNVSPYALREKNKLKPSLAGKIFGKTPPPQGGGIKASLHRPKYPTFDQKPDFFRACGAVLGTLISLKRGFLMFLKSLLFFKLYFLYFPHSPNLKTNQWIYFWIYKSATGCPTWGNRFKFWKTCIFFISIKFSSYSYGVWEDKMNTKLWWGKLVRYLT